MMVLLHARMKLVINISLILEVSRPLNRRGGSTVYLGKTVIGVSDQVQ